MAKYTKEEYAVVKQQSEELLKLILKKQALPAKNFTGLPKMSLLWQILMS